MKIFENPGKKIPEIYEKICKMENYKKIIIPIVPHWIISERKGILERTTAACTKRGVGSTMNYSSLPTPEICYEHRPQAALTEN